MRPPITDRQALEWSWRYVDRVIREWIAEYESNKRLADNSTDRYQHIVFTRQANIFMRCAAELHDLDAALRLMTTDDKPPRPELKLVVDNDHEDDTAG